MRRKLTQSWLLYTFLVSSGILFSSPLSAFNVNTYLPGGSVISSFDGPYGWRGHITENQKGIRVIVWETPRGMGVVGKLLDANGRDLSQLAQSKYQTNPVAVSVLSKIGVSSDTLGVGDNEASSLEDGIYGELQKLDKHHYTTTFPSHLPNDEVEQELYVFYDFECPYCASAKEYLQSAGVNTKVHWLPVAILSSSSANYGAGVLDDTVSLEHLANQAAAKHPKPSRKSLEAVAHNTTLLKAMQKRASTPTFIYKTPSGDVLTLNGFSETTAEALSKMLNAG